jgi:hypothetical protein
MQCRVSDWLHTVAPKALLLLSQRPLQRASLPGCCMLSYRSTRAIQHA